MSPYRVPAPPEGENASEDRFRGSPPWWFLYAAAGIVLGHVRDLSWWSLFCFTMAVAVLFLAFVHDR